MKTEMEQDTLVIFLEGNISSENSKETEREIQEALDAHPEQPFLFDADRLEYITSAGLRVLLRFQKQNMEKITVRNLSAELYEIFDMTGFTVLMNCRKKLRTVDVEGCEVIGVGAVGTVYRMDEDTIVKVYGDEFTLEMIENERDMSRKAFLRGIPTAIPFDVVRVGDSIGAVYEMVKARNGNDYLRDHPEEAEKISRDYAEFLRTVHAVECDPGELEDIRRKYLRDLDEIRDLLPEETCAKAGALIESVPESLHIVHGDIHLKNVMLTEDGMMLIDMDTLSCGQPIFDFAALFVTYVAFGEVDHDNPKQFLGIDRETVVRVFELTTRFYLKPKNEEEYRAAVDRISVPGYVRYLRLQKLYGPDDPELRERCISHAVGRLRELTDRLTDLNL